MGLFGKKKTLKLYALEGAFVQDGREIININFTYQSISPVKAIEEVTKKIQVAARKVISRSQMGEDRQMEFEVEAAIKLENKILHSQKFRMRAPDRRTAKHVFNETVSIKIKSAKEQK